MMIGGLSKKQPPISRSSAEFKYRSLAHACVETTCILFGEIGVLLTFPILLHCDNLGATYLSTNPIHHACTCQIKLYHHFVCEKVAIRSNRVCYIPSGDQPVNLLTKALR